MKKRRIQIAKSKTNKAKKPSFHASTGPSNSTCQPAPMLGYQRDENETIRMKAEGLLAKHSKDALLRFLTIMSNTEWLLEYFINMTIKIAQSNKVSGKALLYGDTVLFQVLYSQPQRAAEFKSDSGSL
mmetsp:Transcript_6429/g.7811  ORF Transcript_6429/g.7811 Transcript_6429/m.7811 type:complete len:128 (+) Transcript_6429:560-943(+)